MAHRLIIFLLIPICIFGQDSLEWTPVDYTLASTFVIAQVLDYGLTNHAINTYGMKEVNPLYGSHPSMTQLFATKVIISAFGIMVIKNFTSSVGQRRLALIVYNIISWTPVILNINTLQRSGYTVSLRFSL